MTVTSCIEAQGSSVKCRNVVQECARQLLGDETFEVVARVLLPVTVEDLLKP
jgi:hypothetical protein